MSIADEELVEEINEALESYYDEDAFDNLYDAAEALLAQFLDYEEAEDEEEDDDDELSHGSDHEEPAKPMTELDRAILSEERYLQMERAIEIAKRELQKLKEEENEDNLELA